MPSCTCDFTVNLRMLGWQNGPAAHLWVVKASSHIHAGMVIDSSFAAVFIMFILFWDLYVCPQTLAMASACLRNSALIRILVLLCCCKLSFYSLAVAQLMMEGENQKKKRKKKPWTATMSTKRFLFWLLWCVSIVALSTPAILYQVVKSIPGFLHFGKILSLGLGASIGAIQGWVSSFIVPYLASRMTWQKHMLTAVSSLLMSCLLPSVLTIYLDAGCLARWVTLWEPCQSNSQSFQSRLICSTWNQQDCIDGVLEPYQNIDIMLLRSSDMCEPHFSWSSTSISRCMHISLLRLQEVWLGKFITIGLVWPGLALMVGKLPRHSGAIVGNFGIYMAYALVSSGHLPLMNFILLLAFLGEGLVGRVAWVEKRLKAKHVKNVAAPVVKMARLVSLMVHLASVAGDPHTLVTAIACIFMLIKASCTGMRPPAG